MAAEYPIDKVAEQYRKTGYDVTVRPHGEAAPAFLGDFSPDLIARKGEEAVVVAVTSRHELAADPTLAFVADVVAKQRGWRLDVVFFGGDEEPQWPDRVDAAAAEPSVAE